MRPPIVLSENGDLAIFKDIESLLRYVEPIDVAKVLTPKRMELLHHLRQRPASTVADLARALDRDYKRVREDVEYLSDLGLVERDATGLRVDVDEIRAAIAI